MPNLDSVLTTLNTNTETNTAIHSSQFDSVRRNGHLLAALPCQKQEPRGLETCQQHCKISATGVSENVYLCSKLHYHESKICIGR